MSKRKSNDGHEKQKQAGEGLNGRSAESLNTLAKENVWRLFNVTEIRAIFNIGEQTMIRYRKLSARDQATDPWINDLTRPEKFEAWLWGKRIALEMQHKDV